MEKARFCTSVPLTIREFRVCFLAAGWRSRCWRADIAPMEKDNADAHEFPAKCIMALSKRIKRYNHSSTKELDGALDRIRTN